MTGKPNALIEPAPSHGAVSARQATLGDRVRALKLPEQTVAKANWGRWFVAAGVALVVMIGGWFAYYRLGSGITRNPNDTGDELADLARTEQPKGSATSTTGASLTPPPAPATVAASGDVALESKGYIIPAHQILVSPKVNGMVLELNFEEGKRVSKGDVLARIESVDYQADVERAAAVLAMTRHKLDELEHGSRPEEIAQSKAELEEAIAERDQLLADYKRNVGLRNNKVLTEREIEQAESAFKAKDRRVEKLKNGYRLMVVGPRQERINLAKAEVQQSQADLVKAKWRLQNCTIVAPVSGTILKKNAEEGNIVNTIAFNGSFSLCDMADLSDLEVDLSIQERDVAKVHKGQRCQVRAEAFPDRSYAGVVARLMPIADRAKGAVPVRVKLTVPADEEGVYLKPEMGAVVTFLKD